MPHITKDMLVLAIAGGQKVMGQDPDSLARLRQMSMTVLLTAWRNYEPIVKVALDERIASGEVDLP
jgi:hypothetical protein